MTVTECPSPEICKDGHDAAAHAYFAGMAEIRAARIDGAPARVRFKRALNAARPELSQVTDELRVETIRTMLKTEAFRRA